MSQLWCGQTCIHTYMPKLTCMKTADENSSEQQHDYLCLPLCRVTTTWTSLIFRERKIVWFTTRIDSKMLPLVLLSDISKWTDLPSVHESASWQGSNASPYVHTVPFSVFLRVCRASTVEIVWSPTIRYMPWTKIDIIVYSQETRGATKRVDYTSIVHDINVRLFDRIVQRIINMYPQH